MGISRFIRCDACEYSEALAEDCEPCDIGWLNLIYGETDEDMAYFCGLLCLGSWATSAEAQELLAQMAEFFVEDEEE
jgi:hypothetical protein